MNTYFVTQTTNKIDSKKLKEAKKRINSRVPEPLSNHPCEGLKALDAKYLEKNRKSAQKAGSNLANIFYVL